MLSCLRVCNLCERVQRLAAHSHPRIMFCICRVLISNLPAGCRGRGNPLLNLPKKKSPLRFQLTLCKGNRSTNRGETFAYLSRWYETRIRDGPGASRQYGGRGRRQRRLARLVPIYRTSSGRSREPCCTAAQLRRARSSSGFFMDTITIFKV